MCGGGGAYNEHYVDATDKQARSEEKVGLAQANAEVDAARLTSQAQTDTARYDYQARVMEAKLDYKAQMEALRVREKEAELTYQVDFKNAQNDAIRADASMIAANSQMRKADANVMREERKSEKDKMRYADRASAEAPPQTDWYYGY